jgi:hypothetical protein
MAKTEIKTKTMLAEFDSAASLTKAAEKLRDSGFKKFDCYSPFPIHGLNDAMGVKRSYLGFIVGTVAAFALGGAFLMVYWMQAVDYPLIISGKPYNSYQAYTPVIFAVTVLLSAIATVLGMLALSGLPRLNHPLFDSREFQRFSDDGFFVSIDIDDPKFDSDKTAGMLTSIGARKLEVIEG